MLDECGCRRVLAACVADAECWQRVLLWLVYVSIVKVLLSFDSCHVKLSQVLLLSAERLFIAYQEVRLAVLSRQWVLFQRVSSRTSLSTIQACHHDF